ncbi:MAG TPA: hypothetical protein VF179_12030 [Thermoanaerobaculia bacterium]|nr:hypothetical protein [Thermoanaerobaculia bacterium]
MKAPHLLRVEDAPESFSQLVEAARADGLRVGWLELAEVAPLPEVLASAAGLGLLRAVSAGGGRTVAVKPLRGEPVLKDLLREHFLGCALVLVRGAVDAPHLRRDGENWVIDVPEQAGQPLTTAQLAGKIRSPLPLI